MDRVHILQFEDEHPHHRIPMEDRLQWCSLKATVNTWSNFEWSFWNM